MTTMFSFQISSLRKPHESSRSRTADGLSMQGTGIGSLSGASSGRPRGPQNTGRRAAAASGNPHSDDVRAAGLVYLQRRARPRLRTTSAALSGARLAQPEYATAVTIAPAHRRHYQPRILLPKALRGRIFS